MLIYRGKLVTPEEALVPADDHGLLYGAGGFETFRTFAGKGFLLDKHLERLRRTLSLMCIENLDTLLMVSEERLTRAVDELLTATGRTDGVFRYGVSAGPAGHHLPQGPYTRPWDMLTVRDLPAAAPEGGLTLRLLQTPRDSGEVSPRGKSFAYLNSLIAWRERQGCEGAHEGLMLNAAGQICEGVTCNVFWIHAGELKTPSVEMGLLPGVHRGHLLELARAEGITVCEGKFSWEEFLQAEAIGTINAATGPRRVGTVQDRVGVSVWRANPVAPEAFSRIVELYHASLPQA